MLCERGAAITKTSFQAQVVWTNGQNLERASHLPLERQNLRAFQVQLLRDSRLWFDLVVSPQVAA